MKNVMVEKLKEIEAAERVRILYDAESGNSARGFASPDSDRDVRFVCAREPEAYLGILPKRDAIECPLCISSVDLVPGCDFITTQGLRLFPENVI